MLCFIILVLKFNNKKRWRNHLTTNADTPFRTLNHHSPSRIFSEQEKTINPNKCHDICHNSWRKPTTPSPKLSFNSSPLVPGEQIRNLGIHFDMRFTWKHKVETRGCFSFPTTTTTLAKRSKFPIRYKKVIYIIIISPRLYKTIQNTLKNVQYSLLRY